MVIQVKYQCKKCGMKSLNRVTIRQHVKYNHKIRTDDYDKFINRLWLK